MFDDLGGPLAGGKSDFSIIFSGLNPWSFFQF